MHLEPEVEAAAAAAGQLLIRAAATLGTLKPEQLESLSKTSPMPQMIADAIAAAVQLAPEVARSMRDHPPRGFAPGRIDQQGPGRD